MTTLVSNKFKQHLANQFIESIDEPANNIYYVLASKHTPYANDDVIPTPSDTLAETTINIHQEAIFGKKIQAADVKLTVPKYEWTYGTVYSQYDHEDADLFSKSFYTVVDGGSTYYVYKVLDNNRGASSTVQPTNTSESACNFITTADGYVWKLLYSMPEAEFEKFETDEYMPVVTSANVAGNTVAGALDVIQITDTGSHYVATLTGQFQADDLRDQIPSFSGNNTTYRLNTSASANNDFYVGSALYISSGTGAGQLKNIISYNSSNRVITVNSAFTTPPSFDSEYRIAPNVIVTGDGANASGYATVSSNSTVNNFISKINIVSRGSGYTYAAAVVTGNTGGVSNTASVRPIIPPPGGHGFNTPEELGCTSVGVTVTYNTNESGFITVDNDYRKIAIIKDPLFNNVTLTLTNESGSFSNNETIHQISTKKLVGTVAGNNTSSTLTGLGTEFDVSLKSGDYVLITDNTTSVRNLRVVDSISNSTSLTLTSNLSFVTSFSTISYVDLLATGKKTGNTSPYLTMTNVEPKFVTEKTVIGASSGAIATVDDIDVNEKSYNNWSTLDNRTRIAYSSSSGSMPEDAVVFQTDISFSNAFFHSANATYVFLTSEKGPINADSEDLLVANEGSASFTLDSTRYSPDIIKNSGQVLYIENKAPISRSISQSETIKLTVKF
jgi:hypothetical protein